MLVGWPYINRGANADALVADVNRAYHAVPGFTWTSTQDGELSGLRTTRVTRLEAGIVVGLTEEVGVTGRTPLQTIVTGERIWISHAGWGCWTAGGPPDGLGIGGPVIPTAHVRFEEARRSSAGWRLVAHDTVGSVTYRTEPEYLIDPDSLLISRISRRIQGAPCGDTTQTMTFAELGGVPEIVTPTAICQR